MGAWATPSIRDDVVEFVQRYSQMTGLPRSSLVSRIGIGRDKFYEWRRRRGGKVTGVQSIRAIRGQFSGLALRWNSGIHGGVELVH